jgi:hypothetical protein
MKVEDLKIALQYANDGDEVTIAVKLPYATVGSIPMVAVKNATTGFDWESGKFIIRAVEKLAYADRDFDAQFKELQTKYGWLDYENRNLKAEIKKLKGMIK